MDDRIVIGDQINFERDIETTLSMSFLPLDIFDNWSRAGSLSDFIAEYFGSYFEGESSNNIISTVFNEFIENAVKFTKNNSQPIMLVVKKRGGSLITRITNTIPRHRKTEFISVCNDLYGKDLEDLFLERIKDGAEDSTKSGIGLILIKKDYQVETSFDFFEDGQSVNKVAVTFKMDLD